MKGLLLCVAVGFGLVVAGGFGIYTYSTHPSFCNSCHIMEPYYEAWRSSQHFGKASCVQCHYPPPKTFGEHLWHKFQSTAQVVKYVTRTYSSRPFADIPDASCLRSGCHSARLLEGKLVTDRGIQFDHRPHLTETRRGRQLRCVSCHSQIVVGRHIEVAYDTCYLCHFREGERPEGGETTVDCLECHEIPSRSFQIGNMTYNHKDFVTARGLACRNCHLEVVRGEGRADRDRCLTCHNQPEKLARYDDIPFLHENHVIKHHVACLHCHQEMRHGREEMPTLTFDCSFCHESKHTGQLEMYSGKVETLDLPLIPSPMYLANVDCVGCHYQSEQQVGEAGIFAGKTFHASEGACVKCHGPKFTGIWEETKRDLDVTLTQMEQKQEAVRSALVAAALTEGERQALQKKMDQVEKWHQFLRLGRGEHNIYLAAVTLRKAEALLSEVGQKAGATAAPDLSGLPLLSGGYCATMCHEKVGVKVPPETVTAFGKTMPHRMHTGLMGCVTCHEIGAHKQVPLRADLKKTVCSGCHPE